MLDLDFGLSENLAMSMARRMDGVEGSWGDLVAVAQHAVSSAINDEIRGASPSAEANDARLLAAARILDAASLHAVTDAGMRRRLALWAALAFALDGNSTGATTLARRAYDMDGEPERSEAEIIALATLSPSLLGELLDEQQLRPQTRAYLVALNAFLVSGDEKRIDALSSLLTDSFLALEDPWGFSLLRGCQYALTRATTLATSRMLSRYAQHLPHGYIAKLVEEGKRLLLPPQHSILRAGFLDQSENAIISLPTSTGKTLLGELALLAALRNTPGLVCFVAPYIAIGRQVAHQLSRHLPSSFRVHRLFGEFKEPPALRPDLRSEVVVATIERFDALVRAEAYRNALRAVVIDEAHSITSGERGARLEGICARMLLQQDGGNVCRMVLLSAVMDDMESVADWLRVPSTLRFQSPWRPTARRLAFWRDSGQLEWHVGDDIVRRRGADDLAVIGKRTVLWPATNLYPASSQAQKRYLRPSVDQNVAYLADLTWQEHKAPVLCVCATKAATRSLATAVAARFEQVEPLPPAVGEVTALINERFPHLRLLAFVLSRGVAYHNASLPSEIRSAVESAASKRQLRVVVATTTLAEGVDLPFRTTILADWLMWNGDRSEPMAPLLFRNIAGRCGRAGTYTEGDTIVFDNPLGEAEFTSKLVRKSAQLGLLGPAHASQSPLSATLKARDRVGPVLAGQMLAAIGENPERDSIVRSFRDVLLASRGARATPAFVKRFAEAEDSILNEERGALARAASPLRLTPLGVAFNATGFSPETNRRLLALLSDLTDDATIETSCAHLLRGLADAPEQSNKTLRDTVTNPKSKCCVKPVDLDYLVGMWRSKTSMIDMFTALGFVQRSKSSVSLVDWMGGEKASETWDSRFDDFTDFVESVFRHFLPWVLRACATLDGFSGKLRPVVWRELADELDELSQLREAPQGELFRQA